MTITRINDRLSVMPQPDPEEFNVLMASDFKAIINVRPDGEEAGQPGTKAEEKAAEYVGLSYSFIPVTVATITEADVRPFQGALEASEAPVVAHCKSGTRALLLYVIGEVLDNRMKVEDVHSFG